MEIAGRHDTRCHLCKSKIYSLLGLIHGAIEFKFKATGVSVELPTYLDTEAYSALKEIYQALVSIRGYDNFVNAKTLQRCDLFVPASGTVVELDEIQHFTEARAVALMNYPQSLAVGFDKAAYIERCQRLRRRDNDPKYPYRDEQRAWYDTVRDFLPVIRPRQVRHSTIRIPLGFHEWCQLAPENSTHLKYFRELAGV